MVPNRLIVGAGPNIREGWKTLDAVKRDQTDFVAKIPPFPDAVKAIKWDEIEWIHGVSSLYPWEAVQALREIHAMLSSDGTLILEQPNFSKLGGSVLWTFGDPQFRDPLHMNNWGYTPDSLTALLSGIGFSQIELKGARYHYPDRDFRIEARK